MEFQYFSLTRVCLVFIMSFVCAWAAPEDLEISKVKGFSNSETDDHNAILETEKIVAAGEGPFRYTAYLDDQECKKLDWNKIYCPSPANRNPHERTETYTISYKIDLKAPDTGSNYAISTVAVAGTTGGSFTADLTYDDQRQSWSTSWPTTTPSVGFSTTVITVTFVASGTRIAGANYVYMYNFENP